MLETEYSLRVQRELSKYFDLRLEVWDRCVKSRIDIIATCKKYKVDFGIEVKSTEYKTGKDIGELINQAKRYSTCEFPNYEGVFTRIPIFVVPQLSYDVLHWHKESQTIDGIEYHTDRHHRQSDHHGINGMLGAMNIGEIKTFNAEGKYKPWFEFKFSNKTIWSSKPEYNSNEARCLHLANYNDLMKKI